LRTALGERSADQAMLVSIARYETTIADRNAALPRLTRLRVDTQLLRAAAARLPLVSLLVNLNRLAMPIPSCCFAIYNRSAINKNATDFVHNTGRISCELV
jgi:hypothetical protein